MNEQVNGPRRWRVRRGHGWVEGACWWAYPADASWWHSDTRDFDTWQAAYAYALASASDAAIRWDRR